MENPQIKPQIAPFKHLCMSIGAIPTSFQDAMDYYECVLWLIKYLENTIIPVVNNNGEAVAELQDLYITLKNYVENYFENLDVQEEINNKLDEMSEDGTLENLLNNYIEITKVYNTYNDMISDTNLVNNQKVKTLGYYAINDEGGAYYYITDTADLNSIQFQTANNLYATLIVENNTLYSKQLGLKGDGLTDETTALQAFYDNNTDYTKVLQKGAYVISNTLYIRGLWRRNTGNNGNISFKFDNSSFKYTGTANGYSVILYSMFKETIENLCITQDSNHNKLGIIGCWFDEFKNLNVDGVDISNNVSILNDRDYSTLSNEYCNFTNCSIRYGLIFNTVESSYTNAIHFYNSNISAGNNAYAITVTGAKHNQSLTFNGCDISYASTANFYIADTQTGHGNIACTDCYFDSSIKMYKDNDPNGMIFTFINSMLASGGANDKTNILVKDMMNNVILGGITNHGFSIPTLNCNLAINGNFESDTEPAGHSAILTTPTGGSWTKEYVSSNKNINGRSRKITSVTTTTNARLNILSLNAPITSEYTFFMRFRILQQTENSKTGISCAMNGNYYGYQAGDLDTAKDYILVHNKLGVLQENTPITIDLYFSNPTDLIIEFYEVGVIPGKMIIPNAPLHKNAKIS